MTELILEGVRIERIDLRWPVTDRVVYVGQHGEYVVAFGNEPGDFSQVLPNDLRRSAVSVATRWLCEPVPVWEDDTMLDAVLVEGANKAATVANATLQAAMGVTGLR